MENVLVCPKCAGAMEEGFTVDRGNAVFVANWQPGRPEPEHFLGMNMGSPVAKRNQWRPIVTYRCTQCGFLESYAP